MKAYDLSSLVIALNLRSVMGFGLCLRRGLNRANNGLAAHCGDEKRFMVHADQLLGTFVALQRAIHEFAVSLVL
jgi:hypothetical protein